MHDVDNVRDEKNVTLYRHEIGWVLRGSVHCVRGSAACALARVGVLVKRLFNVYLTLIKRRSNVILTKFERCSNVVLTLFLRRLVQKVCHWDSPGGDTNRQIRQAATQNRLRRTPLLSRQNWVVFKRRRHCIVYDDTVADRPRGFGIDARTKFPRRGGKGRGCGRRPLN